MKLSYPSGITLTFGKEVEIGTFDASQENLLRDQMFELTQAIKSLKPEHVSGLVKVVDDLMEKAKPSKDAIDAANKEFSEKLEELRKAMKVMDTNKSVSAADCAKMLETLDLSWTSLNKAKEEIGYLPQVDTILEVEMSIMKRAMQRNGGLNQAGL